MTAFATRSKWLFFASFLLLAAVLSACTTSPNYLWLDAPGWSRAKLVGVTIGEHAAPPALDTENNAYFLLVNSADGSNTLNLIAVDSSAQSLWGKSVPFVSQERIHSPRVVLQENHLLLFWIEADILYGLVTDLQGEPVGDVFMASGSHEVDSYSVAVSPDGELVAWFSGPRLRPGLYAYDPGFGITRIDSEGWNPQLQFDAEGGLHAVWFRSRAGDVEYRILYNYSPEGVYDESETEHLYTTLVAITSGMYGPILGLDQDQAYVFWSTIARTGFSAGVVEAKFISAPYGGDATNVTSDERLVLPRTYHLIYSEADGFFQSGQRALLDEQVVFPTSSLSEILSVPGSHEELVVAARGRLPFLRNKEAGQTALIYLRDGEEVSAQMLSFTSADSQRPSVKSDAQGYLYASWLEGASPGPYSVYFASTRPDLVESSNRLGLQDYLNITADTLFGLVSGMVLIPFPIAWGLVPTLFILFTGRLRQEGEPITGRGTAITLAIAIAMYWFGKLLTLPGFVTYVPFSAWWPFMPQSWELPLRILVPLISTGLGLYVAWRMTYGRDRRIPLFFILMFSAVDGLITIAIYGVIFYNAI